MKQALLIISLFFSSFVFSQTLLKGKVSSETNNIDGIHVINVSNKSSTITERGGFFSILAKPLDTLIFTAIQIKGRQIVLKKIDFSEDLFFVTLLPQITLLDEVIVKSYPNINAVSLGILSKPAKKYTPAERRLRTAGDFRPFQGDGVAIDPILNAISGRTAMLKKELIVERKELFQAKIVTLYEDVFYIETLKIPKEYIKGFQLFVLEDGVLIKAIKEKNTTMTTFRLGELAENYKKITFPEKK